MFWGISLMLHYIVRDCGVGMLDAFVGGHPQPKALTLR